MFVIELTLVMELEESCVLLGVVSLALLVVMLALSVVSLVVLVEEAIVVAIWRKLSIVELLVVVANSLYVLWRIRDIWVVWRQIIGC